MKNYFKVLLATALVFSFVGCSKGQAVKLPTVLDEIKKEVPLKEVMDLSLEDLSDNYGIESKDVTQFAGEITTTNSSADEIVMIEGKDKDSTERIKKSLEERLKSKENQAANYNAAQAAVIKKSNIKVNGNFVSMIVTTDVDKAISVYNKYVK